MEFAVVLVLMTVVFVSDVAIAEVVLVDVTLVLICVVLVTHVLITVVLAPLSTIITTSSQIPFGFLSLACQPLRYRQPGSEKKKVVMEMKIEKEIDG